VLYVDQGYTRQWETGVVLQLVGAKVDVIQKNETGFKVLPIRWLVERTRSWLGQDCRLNKKYELLPEMSESTIYVAIVRLMLRRLTTNKFAA
jgi:transposase